MNYIKTEKLSFVLPLFVILGLAVLFAVALKLSDNSTETSLFQQGVLDLSDWDPAQNGLISLSGNWEFYWLKLLDHDELNSGNYKQDLLVQIPKVWNGYKINGQNLPGFGYATYRLKVKNAAAEQKLAIRMSTVSTAYKLYINDRLIASNGEVGTDKQHFRPEYRPVMVAFIPPAKNFDIILQVANFSYARGGAWYPLFMGSSSQIAAYDKEIVYKDFFLLGAFFIMALYYLCIFLMRREDRASLYFILLCLIAIGRTLIYGEFAIYKLFPGIDYHTIVTIDYVTLIWFPVIFLRLIGELFPRQTSPKLIKAFSIYAALLSLFVIIFPAYTYTNLSYPIEAILLTITVYAVLCSVRAYRKHKIDAMLIFIGALVGSMAGVHDVLYQNNIISSSFGEFSGFGLLILLFFQAFILGKRLSKAYTDAKLQSEKLIQLDYLKDEFLANTTHELRTPLNAMINIADSIFRDAEANINEKQKAGLAMVVSNGRRLASLVNDIMDYSKLKNYDLKIHFEPVSLKRLVESVVNIFDKLNETDIKIMIDIPDDLPKIYADENRLIQILFNLVGNALKFTESGYVKVAADKEGHMVKICVEDTGTGIAKDQFDTIFESFHQVEDSLTRKMGGTGLGLSISKYLIEAHGGQIWVESEVGVGSKFYFSVPLATEAVQVKSGLNEITEYEIAASVYMNKYINKYPYRHHGNGPQIMIVDDNEASLMSLADILVMENYSVTAVTSSEEFFAEYFHANNWQLVILDVMLPGLSGFEICREIRENYSVSELPVLMLTARTNTRDIVLGMEAGANDYLAKPFDAEELLVRVNTLIELKQSVNRSIASELAFLQAQIKPHFLYNTINTIVSISRYDGEQARNLLINFSNYLRRSFDFKGLSQYVSLKNEIELVRAYIDIEKAQFEERLEVSFDVINDADIKIPVLILQPVVENAVLHGVLPKREGGKIEISIKKEEHELVFSVKDNGVGMEEDKLNQVLEYVPGSGVGLSNINNRLNKIYGSGLQIKSHPGIGTEVKWCIPLNHEEGEE